MLNERLLPALEKTAKLRGGSGSCGAGHFRGSHAPASLKHFAAHKTAGIKIKLPGQSCPGLIEARRNPPALGGTALLPGQSCPGLIEAGGSASRSSHAPP